MEPVNKILGADFELSNALHGGGPVDRVATMLLCEIDGYPRHKTLSGSMIELGRRFLAAGGSAYIDSSHLEINVPEHTDSAQHAPIVHAGLRIAREAQLAAMRRNQCRIHLIANCSDGNESWGSHLNVLMHRSVFEDLLYRKPHLAGFLATHLVTSVIYTGQGMVGPGNNRSHCSFQLSQRADWFEQFFGHETMFSRPLLNQRAEHHAGDGLARLHLIYFDMVLAPVANFLKAGTTQLVLAMIEAGWCDPCLQLEDSVKAASAISRDLTLKQPLSMAGRGRTMTAVEIQMALATLAGEFVSSGAVGGAVPGAASIVAVWLDVLRLLEERDVEELARKTDCWLKYLLIQRYRKRKALSWAAAEVKALDLLFGSLGEDGLFFQMVAQGHIDDMPSEQQIEHFVHEPPDDTRAYLRAHVLRRYGDHIARMDWDRIHFRVPKGRIWWSEATLRMPDPRSHGRRECEEVLSTTDNLEELIERLTNESVNLYYRPTETDHAARTTSPEPA